MTTTQYPYGDRGSERGSWDLWHDRGSSWQWILGSVDAGIEQFLESVSAEQRDAIEIERHRWDAPDRLLTFPARVGLTREDDGSWRNIHAAVVGEPPSYFVRFGCAAWFDHGAPPAVRYWCHNDAQLEDQWMMPATDRMFEPIELTNGTAKRLNAVFATVTSWTWNAESRTWVGEGLVAEPPATLDPVADG